MSSTLHYPYLTTAATHTNKVKHESYTVRKFFKPEISMTFIIIDFKVYLPSELAGGHSPQTIDFKCRCGTLILNVGKSMPQTFPAVIYKFRKNPHERFALNQENKLIEHWIISISRKKELPLTGKLDFRPCWIWLFASLLKNQKAKTSRDIQPRVIGLSPGSRQNWRTETVRCHSLWHFSSSAS